MTTTNPFYLAPVAASAVLVHAACRHDGPSARAFGAFALFAAVALVARTALVVLGPVDASSVAAAFLEGLRLAVMLVVFGAFNSVADPFRILRFAPRRFHEAALAAALALSLAPRTIDAARRVREAQRMRGLARVRLRALPALAVPVLETGMEEAVTLAESMDARGHGRARRSRYRPDRWDARAVAVAAVSALAFGTFGAAALGGRGALVVSTWPVAWPDASPALVVAALAFVVPAFVAPRAQDA
ncbi:MAG TPA: energy-coupling factor transporter transmembrane component T [Actinomycetota bacterium]|nr:energy-coupling factor transporter transmembrane component T [Actinomycetota bacterium]